MNQNTNEARKLPQSVEAWDEAIKRATSSAQSSANPTT